MRNIIDHVTIGADDLAQGGRYVLDILDVDLPAGGKHPDMSTHNRVASTGKGEFLELIAIDPDAPAPGHPRWFGLDEARRRARLGQRPAPVGWVVRTDSLDDVKVNSTIELGTVRRMSRGNRTWMLTVPESGMTELDGLAPAFIEWDREPHPADSMHRSGLRLVEVILRHPDIQRLQDFTSAVGIDHLATTESSSEPAMVFRYQLPDGRIVTID